MSTPTEESQEAYVYRRVHPRQYDKKTQLPKSQIFALRPEEKGLSVYDATVVTARSVLQTFVDDTTEMLNDEDETVRARGQKRLDEFPDVETMIAKGWGVVRIPVSEIRRRGFHLTDTEPNGHLEIIGRPERFKECELEFVQLVADGIAPLLTAEECLANFDP